MLDIIPINPRKISQKLRVSLMLNDLIIRQIYDIEVDVTLMDIPHEKTGVFTRKKEWELLRQNAGVNRMILRKWIDEYETKIN